jgi:Tol biopolymer transport system component
MAIDKGQRLGPYEIKAPLGAGGMGEVYRAWDTKLDREVAIKVLPAALSARPDALARFEREAKAVAALNHPNILAIYDFGSHEGTAYAAMELLHGETLASRLAGGALPPRKVTELGRQVAKALGAAHDKGIIHRDLKPENIFVTPDGRAKILDFGLAASVEPSEPGSHNTATRTSLTEPGTVMGTVGYMSPEQVRGHAADHRSDIFSLGSVLYEMFAGRRAFDEETTAETMTAILREEPPELCTAGSEIPPALGRVVRRCLEKQPGERFQSARDLAFAIDNASGATTTANPVIAEIGPVARRRSPIGLVLAAAALIALGLAAGLALNQRAVGSSTNVPVKLRALTVSGRDSKPSASPDGRMIAFASDRDGRARIWIKQLVGGGEEPLTEGPDTDPHFSPDGASVLFLRSESDVMSVFRQALIGGQPRKLVHNATEADWSPDGLQIAFVRSQTEDGRRTGRLGVADARRGEERFVYNSSRALYGARWTLDGRKIFVTEGAVTGNVPDIRFVVVDVESGEPEEVDPGDMSTPISLSTWSGNGSELIFARAGSIIGDQGDPVSRVVRFDLETQEEQLLFWASDLFPLQGLRLDYARFDVVGPGALVFDQTTIREFLMELDAGGVSGMQNRRTLTRGHGRDRQPAYSPDGKQVAFASNRSGNLDLWTLDLASGALHQITDDAAQDWDPGWSPDGKQIVWSSDRRTGHLEIWIANSDGSSPRQVTRDGVDAENPTMAGNGEWIVYWSANALRAGVWKIRPDGTDDTQLASGTYLQPEMSPDGRYAAFVSIALDELANRVHVVDTETGELQPHPIVVPMQLQSGGIIFGRCRWMPQGRVVAFVGMDDQGLTGVYLQDFVPGKEMAHTRRKLAGFSREFITESFGISPDGKRVTIAGLEPSYRLMLAEGVPGIELPSR